MTTNTTAAPLNITARSEALFIAYFKDAGNWGGSPCIGGNVGGSKEDRGNLTQLKRAGLIVTDGEYIDFTPAGIEYAAARGLVAKWL